MNPSSKININLKIITMPPPFPCIITNTQLPIIHMQCFPSFNNPLMVWPLQRSKWSKIEKVYTYSSWNKGESEKKKGGKDISILYYLYQGPFTEAGIMSGVCVFTGIWEKLDLCMYMCIHTHMYIHIEFYNLY